jgi:hypothetical protein
VSGDETFVLLGSLAGALIGAFWWYQRIIRSPQAMLAIPEFLALALAPPIALIGVSIVIARAGSFDVQGAPNYELMYCLLGVVWFLGAAFAMETVGVSFRDDAIERRNTGAAVVVVSALFAHAAIYAGANIGNGPGWWTVVIAAGIGSGVWFALWIAVDVACGLSEDITVERDLPAGIRLGGFAIAIGLICARGAAGDWTSLSQTIAEFVVAWPALVVAALAVLFEKLLDAQPEHYKRNVLPSVAIAVFYVGVAAVVVDLSGPLPHNPAYNGVSPPSS